MSKLKELESFSSYSMRFTANLLEKLSTLELTDIFLKRCHLDGPIENEITFDGLQKLHVIATYQQDSEK